jgi:hypothetical protein
MRHLLRRTRSLGLALLALIACARPAARSDAAAAVADAAPPYPVVDLMPSFWTFWDQDRPAARE